MEEAREQWGSRLGFLMAAIGSAVGLGNIWRFPYVAYENGGGAFLLPYLIALLTAGIPILILMYAIGHKYRASPPLAWRRVSRPAEAIGWWQVAICIVISSYYAVIIAWAVRYTGFSFGLEWGDAPDEFFGSFVPTPEISDAGSLGGFDSGVVWPLAAVWVVTIGVLLLGVSKGIEKANLILIPLLLVLFGALVVRALFLDGAEIGLDALFTPDWEAITDGSVWVAAYGQIFFSLSVGFGIMITYASYLQRKADLSGSAMVAGFANSSFEILAGIGVFAVLGFMSAASGLAVSEVATSGIGLAFVAFPQIISEMPASEFFGVAFFGSLVIAGFTSLISIVQVSVAAVQDRTRLGRIPSVVLVGGGIGVISMLIYPREGGLYYLDVADHFINQYGIAMAALVAVVVVAWLLRKLPAYQSHVEEDSSIPLRVWWQFVLGLVTPLVLGWMMVDSLRAEFDTNYGDLPTGFLNSAGWGVALGALVLGILLALIPWRREQAQVSEQVAD